MKENVFTLAKARSKRYSAQTITDADYTDDMALLANAPVQAEFLQHGLEKAAGDIGLHVNADKMKYMCFNQNQKVDNSTLKSASLKLGDKFTYFESSVSSTENEISK